jgi:hypothetical protein
VKRQYLSFVLLVCGWCLLCYMLASKSVGCYIARCGKVRKQREESTVLFWRDSACCSDSRLSPVHS